MSKFIKAKQGKDHTVIYTDVAGKRFQFSGGTWTWRNHNPGNVRVGSKKSVVRRFPWIGRAGGFAVFPDYETGEKAMIAVLKTPLYQNKSIPKLVDTYAPKEDNNNVVAYTRFLRKETGVEDDRKLRAFTSAQFEKLWRAIKVMEGYKIGKITEIRKITAVKANRKGIYAFCVDGLGWLSKKACIKLVKQGAVDAVLCISPLGTPYLRSRPDNDLADNFCKMIVSE